jgi:hypothetical protein
LLLQFFEKFTGVSQFGFIFELHRITSITPLETLDRSRTKSELMKNE